MPNHLPQTIHHDPPRALYENIAFLETLGIVLAKAWLGLRQRLRMA